MPRFEFGISQSVKTSQTNLVSMIADTEEEAREKLSKLSQDELEALCNDDLWEQGEIEGVGNIKIEDLNYKYETE